MGLCPTPRKGMMPLTPFGKEYARQGLAGIFNYPNGVQGPALARGVGARSPHDFNSLTLPFRAKPVTLFIGS